MGVVTIVLGAQLVLHITQDNSREREREGGGYFTLRGAPSTMHMVTTHRYPSTLTF